MMDIRELDVAELASVEGGFAFLVAAVVFLALSLYSCDAK